MVRLDDRVVIVTGGGRGLGRSYALDLAAHGATVIVNDLGCAVTGEAQSTQPADEVVALIERHGGRAIANHDDVASPEGAARLVASALDGFGRLDGLVNNAGIMRDRTLRNMPVDDLESVVRVHLLATMWCTHAAWPALIESGAGRVVMITSAVGLFGGVGQANYAAAKAGVVGFMHTLKLEGRRYQIGVNAVAPVGASRMSEPHLDTAVAAGLDPGLVAPVVTYLCSPDCTATGVVLEVGAGFVARVHVVEAQGTWIAPERFDADEVAARFEEIGTAEDARAFDSAADALARIFERAGDLARSPR